MCDPPHSLLLFIFIKDNKTRSGGELRCHTKNTMNRETFEGPIFEVDVFIITDKAKTSRGGVKRCRCYEDEEIKIEDTIVNRSPRIFRHKDKGLVVEKTHEPVYI